MDGTGEKTAAIATVTNARALPRFHARSQPQLQTHRTRLVGVGVGVGAGIPCISKKFFVSSQEGRGGKDRDRKTEATILYYTIWYTILYYAILNYTIYMKGQHTDIGGLKIGSAAAAVTAMGNRCD